MPQVPGYEFELIDDHTLEVEVSKEQSLNEVFANLTAQGIGVLSMRNKVNRLEELFMKLVERKPARRRRVLMNDVAAQTAAADSAQGAAARALDRLQDHHHPRVRPHRPHLGADHRAVGGHLRALLRHLR